VKHNQHAACHSREEGNEPVKLEIARSMGAWCTSADAMPAEAQKHFERGLGEKDSLLQAHLQSLVQVIWLSTILAMHLSWNEIIHNRSSLSGHNNATHFGRSTNFWLASHTHCSAEFICCLHEEKASINC